MTTYKLSPQTVEDYLEYLAGYELGSNASNMFTSYSPTISLARYDINIVNSMAQSTLYGRALTDKQAELAVKLVVKYRRQLTNQGVDLSAIDNPVFRLAPRTLDRTKSISIDNSEIVVRFPYDNKLIAEVKEFKGKSQGHAEWNNDQKVWNLALTEYNLNWAVAWGQANQFQISDAVQDLFDQILAVEADDWGIKLVKTNQGFDITHASNSLREYICDKLGGFGSENLIALVDHAGVLGYTLDDSVLADCPAELRHMARHTMHLTPTKENINMVLDYAELTQRYPICVFSPNFIDIDTTRFDESQVVRFDQNGKTKQDYNPYDVKIVYARKIPTNWEFPVPLLVTTVEMMYGGAKSNWLRRAEKIVYMTNSRLKE